MSANLSADYITQRLKVAIIVAARSVTKALKNLKNKKRCGKE